LLLPNGLLRDLLCRLINKNGRERVAMDLQPNDIVIMKKTHPCGGTQWKILRAGMDFRIECMTCQRQVMLPRAKFEKNVKKKADEVN